MRRVLSRTPWAILLAGFACIPASSQPQPTALRQIPQNNGFLYQPSVGTFWDPSVIFAHNQYYMFTMYGGEAVWLATSPDGVHWKDHGVVLKTEGFKNNRAFKQFVHKAGDRYIMNNGASSDVRSGKDLLLMQSFFYFTPTGRIGFIAQEGEVQFSQLKFYSMSL